MSQGSIVARPKKIAEQTAQPESRRFPALVRVSEEVAQLARELAPMKRVSIAELFSETLKPVFEKMLEEEMRKRLGAKRTDAE